jgi:hypothetical protein
MKNVLIISASPRKNGNSDTLCDRFAQGAKESGNSVESAFITGSTLLIDGGLLLWGIEAITYRRIQHDF